MLWLCRLQISWIILWAAFFAENHLGVDAHDITYNAGAAHLAKLTKSDETKLSSGPMLLLCQLLLSEQPAPSKARYPPIPASATLKISSVFVQLGVVDHLRQRLLEAADQLKPTQSGMLKPPLHGTGPHDPW